MTRSGRLHVAGGRRAVTGVSIVTLQLVAILSVAACGDTDHTKVATAMSPPAVVATGPPAGASPRQAAQWYFGQIEPIFRQAFAADSTAGSVYAGVVDGRAQLPPDADTRLQRAAGEDEKTLASYHAITPPAAFRSFHQNLIDYTRWHLETVHWWLDRLTTGTLLNQWSEEGFARLYGKFQFTGALTSEIDEASRAAGLEVPAFFDDSVYWDDGLYDG